MIVFFCIFVAAVVSSPMRVVLTVHPPFKDGVLPILSLKYAQVRPSMGGLRPFICVAGTLPLIHYREAN